MGVGKSIRLFLTDGTPGGLVTAEIMNWTGHVIAARRDQLAELLDREEARRTGVYVLLGDDPEGIAGLRAYVGEGDDVSQRLRAHNRDELAGGKDFWGRVLLMTSKDANLTKAHVRYLEARLISLGGQAQRASFDNGTAPAPPALPEADVSDMEYYLDQVRIVLPIMGVNIFRGGGIAASADLEVRKDSGDMSPVFKLSVPRHGIAAQAQQIDGEFTVRAGSLAQSAWRGTDRHPGYAQLHTSLIDDGSLRGDGKLAVFTRDVVFSSPSAAGAVVTGRACNGRTSWVAADGVTFGAWESRGVADPDGALGSAPVMDVGKGIA